MPKIDPELRNAASQSWSSDFQISSLSISQKLCNSPHGLYFKTNKQTKVKYDKAYVCKWSFLTWSSFTYYNLFRNDFKLTINLYSIQNVSSSIFKKIHKYIINWHENEQIKNIPPLFSVMFMKQVMMEKRILYFHGTSACFYCWLSHQRNVTQIMGLLWEFIQLNNTAKWSSAYLYCLLVVQETPGKGTPRIHNHCDNNSSHSSDTHEVESMMAAFKMFL